ncbi:hypothetical protein ACOME3_003528 [Neoechinorhynchus agilis]
MTSTLYECKDISERIDLYSGIGLYMKPIARLMISIQMPVLRLPGQAISNWEVTARIRDLISPEEFIWLRPVTKPGIDIMRLEGEVESRNIMRHILPKLDNASVELEGYQEPLRVRANEARIPYPTRHEWETFFKEAKNMNEAKPGERPDTVHIEGLPVRWFAQRISPHMPSEEIIRKVFSQFGDIREIDIPGIDMVKKVPIDPMYETGGHNCLFEVFIQFLEYVGFVKLMDALRGMKLLRMETRGGDAFTANIKVDFDRTKHLSENSIKKRLIERMKAEELEKLRIAEKKRQEEEDQRRREIERLKAELAEAGDGMINTNRYRDDNPGRYQEERRRAREEKRRLKRSQMRSVEEAKQLAKKIDIEERKMIIAQRKLESMRMLEELFNRVKIIVAREELQKREKEVKDDKIKQMGIERLKHVEDAQSKDDIPSVANYTDTSKAEELQ